MKILAHLLFLALLATPNVVSAQNVDKRPNFLIVMADDLGWTDVGAFGSEISTPNIDALAAAGAMFTDFHVSISCSPTRSMLMSGTDNHLAGLGNMGELIAPNQVGKPGYEGFLNDRVVSMAELLRDNGYHTYMSGKWHLGHKHEQFPHARGFQRSFSMLFGGASYWSDRFGMLAEMEPFADYVLDDRRLTELPADFYATRSYTDFLIDAIRDHREDGKPFLAYLAFTAPHDPLHVPEPWLSKYRGRYDDGYEKLRERRIEATKRLGLFPDTASTTARNTLIRPWGSLSAKEQAVEARAMEVYAGMVENMDYHLGRILGFLKDVDAYDNTVIVFLSDNGPNPWYSEDYPGNEGSEWFAQFDNSLANIGRPMSHYAYGMGWSAASSGPFDRFKMTVSEGGIRSPLIVTGPAIPADQHVENFAYVTDIMPTVLEFAGIKHPKQFNGKPIEPMMGRSLKTLLLGEQSSHYGEDEHISGEMLNGKWVRKGIYKAVSVAEPYGDGVWRLFDLQSDPGETSDLAADMPDLIDELKNAWKQYSIDVGVVLTE